LHPYIIAEQDKILAEWAAADPQGIAVVDAALMIESGGYKRFDKLIVVHCRDEVQLQRLMSRDGLSREQAEQRIAAQMPQAEKKKLADYLIDTSDGFEAARARATEVYEKLRESLENSRILSSVRPLCPLCLCGGFDLNAHHRDTENTKAAQRNPRMM